MRALVIVVALLATTARDAAAELPVLARNYLGIGRLSSEALGHPDDPSPYTYSGWVFDLGMEVFVPRMSTRFGAPYGLHLRLDALFYSAGVWSRDGVRTEQVPALLFMDLEGELGVAIAPLYTPRVDAVVKLDTVLGTTRRGVSAAIESSIRVGSMRAMVELALRTGHSWGDALWREQRTRLGVRRGDAYVWLEVLKGFNEDEMERIDYGSFLRGGYLQGALVLGWQLK